MSALHPQVWHRRLWQQVPHAMGLRLGVSALLAWWGLPTCSALLALLCLQWTVPSEAVVIASFFAPLLLLLWWFASFFPQRLRAFIGYVLLSVVSVAGAAWLWL